ncbi:hypothetical protein PAMP_005890 [Pampus punctatissimus]
MTVGDRRGEREYGSDRDPDTGTERKRGSRPSVDGSLLFCSCVGVSEWFSTSSGFENTLSEIRVFFLRLAAQGMNPRWSNVKASLAMD